MKELFYLLIIFVWISSVNCFPSSISQLNNTNSVAITSNYEGYVEGSCDINGDGYQDLIEIYDKGYIVYFGNNTRFGNNRPINVSLANGINGFRIEFIYPERLPVCGDFNGDGFDDIAIPTSRPRDGVIYAIYGKKGPFDANITLNGTNGFTITGSNNQALGITRAICDINGDGVKDLIFGTKSPFYDYLAFNNPSKKIYILYGLKNGAKYPTYSGGKFNQTTIETSNGQIGFYMDTDSMSMFCGDINNDGYDDLLLLNPTSRIIFGRPSFPLLANGSYAPNYNGTDGFYIPSVEPYIQRYRLASFGDFNGDGLTDLAISNSNATAYEVYVILGQNSDFKWNSTFDSKSRDSTQVISFVKGSGNTSYECYSVSLGDLNGDGIDDLQCLSTRDNLVWGVYGSTVPFPPVVTLNESSSILNNQCSGFKFQGANQVNIANSDFNNDGIQDLFLTKDNLLYGIYGERKSVVANLNIKSTFIPYNKSGVYYFLNNNFQPNSTGTCHIQTLNVKVMNRPKNGDLLDFIPPASSNIKVTRKSATEIMIHNVDHSMEFLSQLSLISFTTKSNSNIKISLSSKGVINSIIEINAIAPCVCYSNSSCAGNYQCVPNGVTYQNQDCKTYGCSLGFECVGTKCQLKSRCDTCYGLGCVDNEKCEYLLDFSHPCTLYPFCVHQE
ncbi:tenascin X [Tieghemostelium lacteum]|uniref:Tenascin X n=1 Tax=Tieghemostelium lacteum TaxID=361077 RepID=A0A152AAB1_TIELA|nr:tenascin X [Tieghemostelium lacteum]|eukprot:KYR03158.1 tenascin X [Tieghemostelium lacteum]